MAMVLSRAATDLIRRAADAGCDLENLVLTVSSKFDSGEEVVDYDMRTSGEDNDDSQWNFYLVRLSTDQIKIYLGIAILFLLTIILIFLIILASIGCFNMCFD